MPKEARRITREDLLSYADFAAERQPRRAALMPVKKLRRIGVGPYATFYFENYDTMLFQVQEMLHIERGGEEQVADELAAYNPLIPQDSELVATMMLEIEDEHRRAHVLARLTHIEKHAFLQVGNEKVYAVAEEDVDRTAEDGKTSSVHFLHFPMSDAQCAAFKDGSAAIMLGFDHAEYAHLAPISNDSRTELASDLG